MGKIGGGLGGRFDKLGDLARLNDELREKAARMNELNRQRNDLDALRQKRQGMNELRTGLQKACGEYDRMSDELERQVAGIENITQKVKQAIEDRGAALNQQVGVAG